MKRQLLLATVAFTAASVACTINVDLPRLETGPTETMTIDEPLPAGDAVIDVTLTIGAGSFKLAGGAEGLAEGTIQYNVPDWKPSVESGEGRFSILQGPVRDTLGVPEGEIVNDWDLKLGSAPMNLAISAGAYEGGLDLSGLRLRRLSISDGASSSEVKFDSVNSEEMEKLSYATGASQVTLTGLANANFEEMEFKGGAGDYTLDFSGALQRDATVSITSGLSSLRIVIPSGTNAKVTVSNTVGDVDTEGTWTTHGDTYETGGSGPTLTIAVETGVGSVTLVSQ